MELAIVGGEDFALGFQLAGVTKTFSVEDQPIKKIKELMNDNEVGIIVVDKKTMEKIDRFDREDLERSVKPVVMTLSTEESDENLRWVIKKSIGVDLWEK
ncbi:MAG: V-type ATP synthase subunit F [bacterium]|nr:V-type ATP synthase subunit F [bacterium]